MKTIKKEKPKNNFFDKGYFPEPEKKGGLELTLKEKISPLLGETMEKNWGITIPKLESDITDRLKNPSFNIYIPPNISFTGAKKLFKKEFLKRELELHLGNVSELAKRLGLDRRSIHRAIKQFRLDMDSIRSEQNAEEKYTKENAGYGWR